MDSRILLFKIISLSFKRNQISQRRLTMVRLCQLLQVFRIRKVIHCLLSLFISMYYLMTEFRPSLSLEGLDQPLLFHLGCLFKPLGCSELYFFVLWVCLVQFIQASLLKVFLAYLQCFNHLSYKYVLSSLQTTCIFGI